MVTHLAWHALFMALVWVPFALTALVVEAWPTEDGQRIRKTLTHPFKAVHAYRIAHAHH